MICGILDHNAALLTLLLGVFYVSIGKYIPNNQHEIDHQARMRVMVN